MQVNHSKYIQSAILCMATMLFSLSSLANKELTVVSWSGYESFLPRSSSPLQKERYLIERFAEKQDYSVRYISKHSFSEMIRSVEKGEADLIVSNLTVTNKRRTQVMFTQPVMHTTEYLVQSNNQLIDASELASKTLLIPKETAFEKTAKGLKKTYPGMQIQLHDGTMSVDEELDKVAADSSLLTIMDEEYIDVAMSYRNDIRKSLQASRERAIAWAVNKSNQGLLSQLNNFLDEEFQADTSQQHTTALERIKADKKIRVVMRNNIASYFIWQGELHGFNYELAKHFAKDHGWVSEVIVAHDHESMLKYLTEGRADIALGFLTPTKERKAMGIEFSRPYHYASELLVVREDENNINTISDLKNRSVVTRPSSSYRSHLKQIKQSGVHIDLGDAPETEETEDIINKVAEGVYDTTVSDSHILDLELTWRDDVKSAFAFGEPHGQSWAVRKEDPDLLKLINRYIKKTYRGLFYNVNYKKYFKNTSRINKAVADYQALKNQGKLSPYDDLVKQYADQYGFDWRLMVAQMHQESGFDPDAESWSGAQGLFQVMPRTGEEMGFTDLDNPEIGIHAGIKYLDWVRQRMIKSNVKQDQLIWFTLASYNAGAGHVRDAIRLAKQKGWRGDTWFGNVEKAMLLLSQKEYAAKARYGYVRGHEPVNYVKHIKRRYDAFTVVTGQ